MKPRTIYFCGDESPYGRAHLRPILDAFDVVGVVTATPARWAIFREALSGVPHPVRQSTWKRLAKPVTSALRRRRPGYIDVPAAIKAAGVARHQSFDANGGETLAWVRGLDPDLVLSAAYPQIFGPDLLAAAGGGAVNFHPSLLPRFRGAHPHFWAVATGAETTGVTAHYMTPRIDDGDVIAQAEFPIRDLTYSQVYRRIVEHTPGLVREVAAFFADAGRAACPQDENRATYYRNDREVHRRIFWNLHPAEQIRNLCRTEKAFCFFRGRPLTPLGTTVAATNRNLTNNVHVENGTVVDLAAGKMVVKVADACVVVSEVQAGPRRWSCERWARKTGVRIGERLD